MPPVFLVWRHGTGPDAFFPIQYRPVTWYNFYISYQKPDHLILMKKGWENEQPDLEKRVSRSVPPA